MRKHIHKNIVCQGSMVRVTGNITSDLAMQQGFPELFIHWLLTLEVCWLLRHIHPTLVLSVVPLEL